MQRWMQYLLCYQLLLFTVKDKITAVYTIFTLPLVVIIYSQSQDCKGVYSINFDTSCQYAQTTTRLQRLILLIVCTVKDKILEVYAIFYFATSYKNVRSMAD
jgi:hypothetical protein